MNADNKRMEKDKGMEEPAVVFRLYISGDTPNSTRALENLKSICQKHLKTKYRIETMDTLDDPLRALSEGVFITPTLVKLVPPPVMKVVGDLNEALGVLAIIGRENLKTPDKVPMSEQQQDTLDETRRDGIGSPDSAMQ